MFKQNNKMKLIAGASMLVASLALAGCDSSDNPVALDQAQVRVIHSSPDAPPVNIKLNGVTAINNLDYANSTGFAQIDAGMKDVIVEAIVPGGNLDVITVPDLNFVKDTQTTIMAVNTRATIEPLVVADSAATPGAGEVALNVVHASPAAAGLVPTVDVYVTADGLIGGVNPNFSFAFKGSVDAGILPGGTYYITATGPASKTPVYQSGPVDLTPFAGQKLLIAAIDTVNSTSRAASPIKLLVATSTATVQLLDSATMTGARVIHLSPDADAVATGPVEVFANTTTELIPSFSYTDVVPGVSTYVAVSPTDYIFDVAVDGAGVGASVYTSPTLTLAAGVEYSVIASGYLATTPAFSLLATADNNRSIDTQASIKVIHAAPAAGVVDVFVTPAGMFSTTDVETGVAGQPLLEDFAFASITDYVAVAPASYDIRVVAGGTTAIDITAFSLAAGDVVSVIAREPNSAGAPTDFNVIVLTQ